MKKLIFSIALPIFGLLLFTACGGETNTEDNTTDQNIEAENTDDEQEEEAPIVEEEESALGNFEGLVGEWTVDAATAGVKMDLTFGEDGSFTQKMGAVNGEGTWEVISDERINIVTQNTAGQEWLVTDITDETVNLCWNPDAASPKTIPMQRAK